MDVIHVLKTILIFVFALTLMGCADSNRYSAKLIQMNPAKADAAMNISAPQQTTQQTSKQNPDQAAKLSPVQVTKQAAGQVTKRAAGQATKQVTKQAAAQSITFEKINGISLYDSKKVIVQKLGIPLSISKDKNLPDSEEYQYKHMAIGFNGDEVQYISVPAAEKLIYLDDVVLNIDLGEIKEMLGNPDFVAEDGIVYQKEEKLLKVFISQDTGAMSSIDFYTLSSV